MYKLVTLDIDGTLLNSFGNVSEYTKEIIKKVKEKGVEVILASGRPEKSTLTIAKELDIANYIISGNGAIVFDVKNNEYIFDGFLPSEKVFEIAEFCEKNSVYYNIYTTESIITSELKYNTLFYYKENIKKTMDKRTNINIVENVYEYIKSLKDPNFLKLTICDENQTIFDNILKQLKKIKNISILDTSFMSRKTIRKGSHSIEIKYFYTEIASENINKWNAIEKLAQHLNIKQKEVISIGDNVNDLEMVENAGLGIAMENGDDRLKEVSKYITDDNNEDGVAKALKKFILDTNENEFEFKNQNISEKILKIKRKTENKETNNN